MDLSGTSPPSQRDPAKGIELFANHRKRVPELPDKPEHPILPQESLDRLRAGLSLWRARKSLTPEANEIVADLCAEAKSAGWTPEQLVVAVKDACYTSPELTNMTTTSERDAFLARVVTACIKEFFRTG